MCVVCGYAPVNWLIFCTYALLLNECAADASYGTLKPSSPDSVGGSTGGNSTRSRFLDKPPLSDGDDAEDDDVEDDEVEGELDDGAVRAPTDTRGIWVVRERENVRDGGTAAEEEEEETVRVLGGAPATGGPGLSAEDMADTDGESVGMHVAAS